MKKCIIGISGKKQSGKDTVAKMLIFISRTGIAKTNYDSFETWCKLVQNDEYNTREIVHFADTIKDCVSIIYNIDRSYLDSEYYKDEVYYYPKENMFIKEECLKSDDYIVSKYYPISYCLSHPDGIVKLRELLQFFGTDLCREYLGKDIWIRSGLKRANDVANNYNLCVIPDVRFENEADAICRSSLYGGLIKVIRDNNNSDKHVSENIDFDTEYVIENNGNKLQLFYKVLEVYQKINNKLNLKV